jgi:hypothetical protein
MKDLFKVFILWAYRRSFSEELFYFNLELEQLKTKLALAHKELKSIKAMIKLGATRDLIDANLRLGYLQNQLEK